MLPLSGRDGMLRWNGLDIPMYSWVFGGANVRTNYRRASSQNYPVRNSGINTDILSIRGVQYIPEFTLDSTFLEVLSFDFGWNDFVNNYKVVVPMQGMVSEYIIDILYYSTPQPTYMWTLNLVGCNIDKVFTTESLVTFDRRVCNINGCERFVTTSHESLNAGYVEHVKQATITNIVTRPFYCTASSNNHYAPTLGVNDQLVDLIMEGDFDYWNAQLYTNNEYDYRFYYEPPGSYINVPNMRVTEFDNLTTNLQTAELITAHVRLGASY